MLAQVRIQRSGRCVRRFASAGLLASGVARRVFWQTTTLPLELRSGGWPRPPWREVKGCSPCPFPRTVGCLNLGENSASDCVDRRGDSPNGEVLVVRSGIKRTSAGEKRGDRKELPTLPATVSHSRGYRGQLPTCYKVEGMPTIRKSKGCRLATNRRAPGRYIPKGLR